MGLQNAASLACPPLPDHPRRDRRPHARFAFFLAPVELPTRDRVVDSDERLALPQPARDWIHQLRKIPLPVIDRIGPPLSMKLFTQANSSSMFNPLMLGLAPFHAL